MVSFAELFYWYKILSFNDIFCLFSNNIIFNVIDNVTLLIIYLFTNYYFTHIF